MDNLKQEETKPLQSFEQSTDYSSSGFPKSLIIIFVVIVAVIGLGGYFLGTNTTKNQPIAQISVSPTSVPTPTSDATANWKTYSNLTYGYSIKFPDNYEVPAQTERQKSQLGVDQNRCIQLKQTGACTITIDYWQKSPEEFIATLVNKLQVQDYSIGNIQGKIVAYKLGERLMNVVILPKLIPSTEVVVLTYHEEDNIISQILSTFKFTVQNQAINAQAPSVSPKIISPKKGEVWRMGESHIIQLSKAPEGFKISRILFLVSSTGYEVGTIDCIKNGGSITYEWNDTMTVLNYCGAGLEGKTNIIRPGQYKIELRDEGRVIEESDYFNIVSPSQ